MSIVKTSTKPKTPRRKRVDAPFAENLKKILAERGVSIRAAAELARIPASVISSWISGGMPHDLIAVQRLSSALKVNFEFLLTGKNTQVEKTDISLSELFTEEKSGFEGIYKITATKLVRK